MLGYSEAHPDDIYAASDIPVIDHTPIAKLIAERNAISIIKQIHDSYDSSSQRILDEAKSIIAIADNDEVRKGERLAKLGFTNTAKAIRSSIKVRERNEALKKYNLVVGYQRRYPLYKFITQAQVTEINKKYGLICIAARFYIMDIPEKNLLEIENFKVDPTDCLYSITRTTRNGFDAHNFKTLEEINKMGDGLYGSPIEESFYICCPPQEAIIPEGYSYRENSTFVLEDSKIFPVEDPIVLKPVIGGFLIVTKWGLEASDPLTVNEKMN